MSVRRDGGAVPADYEWSGDLLSLELCREFRRLDREVPVRFGVVGDDDAGDGCARVEADEHVDWTVIAMLLRHEIRRPVCDPERLHAWVDLRIGRIRREMQRRSLERGKHDRGRE